MVVLYHYNIVTYPYYLIRKVEGLVRRRYEQMSKVIRFREQDNESAIIKEVQEILGLNSESEAIRLLILHGSLAIKDKERAVRVCATGLKPEQISNFLSSMKIRLIKEWKVNRKENRVLCATKTT